MGCGGWWWWCRGCFKPLLLLESTSRQGKKAVQLPSMPRSRTCWHHFSLRCVLASRCREARKVASQSHCSSGPGLQVPHRALGCLARVSVEFFLKYSTLIGQVKLYN